MVRHRKEVNSTARTLRFLTCSSLREAKGRMVKREGFRGGNVSPPPPRSSQHQLTRLVHPQKQLLTSQGIHCLEGRFVMKKDRRGKSEEEGVFSSRCGQRRQARKRSQGFTFQNSAEAKIRSLYLEAGAKVTWTTEDDQGVPPFSFSEAPLTRTSGAASSSETAQRKKKEGPVNQERLDREALHALPKDIHASLLAAGGQALAQALGVRLVQQALVSGRRKKPVPARSRKEGDVLCAVLVTTAKKRKKTFSLVDLCSASGTPSCLRCPILVVLSRKMVC